MSNTVAVPTLTPIVEAESSKKIEISVQKPVLKVVPQQPTEPPTLEIIKQMYASQDRECWLCQGISKKIAEGKEISEDDNWHFTSCVLSWEYLHRKS